MEEVLKESLEVAVQKKKFTKTNYALLTAHGLNDVVSIFISTFLISYIYSLSNNYVIDIGLFYFANYLVMAFVYFVTSILIDRTNRINFYRVAIFVKAAFILCIVFAGSKLAGIVYLAGALNGFADGLYWTSYNVMKNELIPNVKVKTYSTAQQVIEKMVNLVVPLILGKLIDVESFKASAIIILVVTVAQLFSSIFIKSNRPKDSRFDLKGFIHNIKNLGERKELVVENIVNAGIYGFLEVLSPINTIIIMIGFDSNFSLGIFKSIASILSLFYILWLNRMTKPGKRDIYYIVTSILPLIAAVWMILDLSKFSIITFSMLYSVCFAFKNYLFDVFRNDILKKLDMYDDIAEFQCGIEVSMEIGRSIMFLIMILSGVVGALWGTEGILVSLKIIIAVEVVIFPILNGLLHKYEKKLVKYELA